MTGWRSRMLPFSGVVGLIAIWSVAIALANHPFLPGPWAVLLGVVDLAQRGLLVKYIVASLFRVTWGFSLATLVAVPLGVFLGWHERTRLALNPFLQMLRPISPLAWIPLAILWFGVGDLPAIFIIFLGSFFPIVFSAMTAVERVSTVHWRAAANFGLSPREVLRRVVFPSALPHILSGMRTTLGIAWLVVVAAEMVAVNSGLGFLIVDARNAGNRYDLVVAGMALIGVIGFALDRGMTQLERLAMVRWAYLGAGDSR